MMTLDDIKTASPEDISKALLIWSNTIPDPDNNFDAQLLIRASEMIDGLQKIKEEKMKEMRRVANLFFCLQ